MKADGIDDGNSSSKILVGTGAVAAASATAATFPSAASAPTPPAAVAAVQQAACGGRPAVVGFSGMARAVLVVGRASVDAGAGVVIVLVDAVDVVVTVVVAVVAFDMHDVINKTTCQHT